MDNLIAKLYQSSKTVLTNKELALIWQENNQAKLNLKTSYYVKRGLLLRLIRGVFAKNKDYNIKELANSLYTPSYVSFETALREAGIIFQYYDTVFVASKISKTLKIDKHIFTFRKIKDPILFNPTGIIVKNNVSIAGPERAFLDMIYLFPNYYFDNLRFINWETCNEIAQIYENKNLLKRLSIYQKNYAQ